MINTSNNLIAAELPRYRRETICGPTALSGAASNAVNGTPLLSAAGIVAPLRQGNLST